MSDRVAFSRGREVPHHIMAAAQGRWQLGRNNRKQTEQMSIAFAYDVTA